jgi:hypothetical protein
MTKLYQVWSKDFNDEKFCFNASNNEEANTKLIKWLGYQGMLRSIKDYEVKEVNTPKYSNNIHNEWIY